MSKIGVFAVLLGCSAVSAMAAAPADETGPGRHIDVAAMHREFCTDHMAFKAGHLAFLAAKLNLTSSQKPLWDSYYKAEMSSARAEQQLCLQSPPHSPGEHISIVEHQSREVKMLQARLEGLQNAQPVLAALYEALTPDQKTALDEHHHHGFGHHGMMGEPEFHPMGARAFH